MNLTYACNGVGWNGKWVVKLLNEVVVVVETLNVWLGLVLGHLRA